MATLPTKPAVVAIGQSNAPCHEYGQVAPKDDKATQDAIVDYLTQDTFDIPAYNASTAVASKVIYSFIATVPFSVPVSASGSYAIAHTLPAAASHDVILYKNATSLGAFSFASATSAGGLGVFAASATGLTGVWNFAAGDQLKLINQATSDSAMANIAFNIKGARL